MRRKTDFIVVHCSATSPSSDIGADEIDQWHRARGFDKIGYHSVIRRNGELEFGRHFEEHGSHVRGQNFRSVGVCLVGGVNERGRPEQNFTPSQYATLRFLLNTLLMAYPEAEIVGHRDLSPDLNGDGLISSDEWMKACPCFDVQEWFYEQAE